MATFLGTRWPPSFTGWPPRMSDEDFNIWTRWWPTVQAGTLALYFDVGLGTGRAIPDGTDPDLAFMWTRNTQKRADVLVERAEEVWLVELRFAAQPSAIGRLLTYLNLLETDNPIGKPVSAILVTNAEDPDVKAVAEKMGITYKVV